MLLLSGKFFSTTFGDVFCLATACNPKKVIQCFWPTASSFCKTSWSSPFEFPAARCELAFSSRRQQLQSVSCHTPVVHVRRNIKYISVWAATLLYWSHLCFVYHFVYGASSQPKIQCFTKLFTNKYRLMILLYGVSLL